MVTSSPAFHSVGRVAFNLVSRRKLLLVLLGSLFLICHILTSQLSVFESSSPILEKIDIVKQRQSFQNPVYLEVRDKLEKQTDLKRKCSTYFNELKRTSKKRNSKNRILTLEEISSFPFDNLVYKEKKFIRQKSLDKKIELNKLGQRIGDTDRDGVEQEFARLSSLTSDYERRVAQDFRHMAVFGKCFIEKAEENDNSDKQNHCAEHEQSLFPWLSNSFPRFENWKHEALDAKDLPVYDQKKYDEQKSSACFLQTLKQKSNGKGIVIPIYYSSNKKRKTAIDNIVNLIRVLRGLKNTLPIELVYSGTELNGHEKHRIIEAARNTVTRIPRSFNATDSFSESPFPEQDVWFVKIDRSIKAYGQPFIQSMPVFNSTDFKYGVSTILNSFEEFVVLTPKTIPMLEGFADELFGDETYKRAGLMLFKSPSAFVFRPTQFPEGFHEVGNFIRQNMMPSQIESQIFGIHKRSSDSVISRVYDGNFLKMIDPNMMVINKTKVLSGLLMGINFQLHELFKARFYHHRHYDHLHDDVNPEFIWMGQEAAGTMERINFNFDYAVSMGVLTPKSLIPSKLASISHELCGSSWGQVSEQDKSKLIFITSHQLENWSDEPAHFRAKLKEKYTLGTDNKQQEELTRNTSERPLHLSHILRPPTLSSPIFDDSSREPAEAWVLQSGVASIRQHPYWCSYNIVGSIARGMSGEVVEVGEDLTARYDAVIDLWMGKDL